MEIGICAIAKDENQYLDEWINHYLNLGVDKIWIYDNNSKVPIIEFLGDKYQDKVEVILWTDTEFKSQSRAYEHCAAENLYYDYIGFFDIDEFIMLKTHYKISYYLDKAKYKHGLFSALGVYWRIYGNPEPFEERQPIENYTKYFKDKHIKSFVNPFVLVSFPDPHKAQITEWATKYIDEKGEKITSPIGEHTSEEIWIKHIFTRSRSEFAEKIERGDANTRVKNRTWEDFENYNKLCVLED